MTGVRATIHRPALAGLLAVGSLGLALAVGCGDDVSDVSFPEQPDPPIGVWFLGVWGTDPDNVYVVGQPGLIYHWNGDEWARQTSGTEVALTDVWGDGAGTVYITGHRGTVLRRSSGGGWSAMNTGTSADLFAVGEYQGTVMVCGRDGTLRQLSGGGWINAPEGIYIRDNEQAVTDTLVRSEDVESITSVAHYGVTASEGIILMDDPETDWLLRRVTGGEDWVTCSTSSDRLSGNFVATDGGRLFQLRQDESDALSWEEWYSPALGAVVYGIYTDDADTVWAVTNDGRINRVDPPGHSFRPLYEDGRVLFDIWGSSGTNLYAVGIGGRVLHFHEVAPDEFGWESEELPLPETKSQTERVFDRFGRTVP
ncbi:MAG TPA: hypothetical protein PLL30_05245 [Candidatus Krumholzibacteria bacterium]|nr:hypothetical protein [Candidatus Krumholzibacteria bacterium]HPD71167.1 hypothetical protein [Candidatus Krumholzibacteria bacterium]HRY39133.1 hypothetical protein [Candidatus Krumholzibacteria bacterium]